MKHILRYLVYVHPNLDTKTESQDVINKKFIITIKKKLVSKWLVSLEKALLIKGWIFLESF